MLEPGTTDYPVSRRGEIDQPLVVGRSCRLSDGESKDTFLPALRFEIPDDNLDVRNRTFVVQVLYVRVEGIIDRIILLFRGECAQMRLILWNFTLMRILARLSFPG